MATFEPVNNRVEFAAVVQTGFEREYVRVIDAGWEIRLIDDDRNTVYSFATGDDNRRANKEQALEALQRKCGWWRNRAEMFTDPPKPPTYFPL
jgi:hypothetical protein